MVKIIGANVHRARLARMRNIKTNSMRNLYAAGELVRKEAAESIIAGSVSGPGHVPSAPGTPPNRDTGNLDKSIDVRPDPSKNKVLVVARAEYAAAQEFGTSKLPERPFMRPALRKHRNAIVKGQVQAVHEVVNVVKNQPYK